VLVVWLFGRLACWSIDRSVSQSMDCLFSQSFGWSVGWQQFVWYYHEHLCQCFYTTLWNSASLCLYSVDEKKEAWCHCYLWSWRVSCIDSSMSLCSELVIIWYIENVEISFSISIYHIVLYRIVGKNIEFFDISRYSKISRYIAIFLILLQYFLHILHYAAWLPFTDWKERLQMGWVSGVVI